MQTHFENDLDHVYLIFDSVDVNEQEYTLQMALRCSVPSLLPLSVVSRDGKNYLRADVTSCTSLRSRFQNVQLNGTHVRRILCAVRDLVSRLPAYLLDPRDIILDPEAIFYGSQHDEILLCYVPHLSADDPDTVRLLADFFLRKIDHSDSEAAQLAYGLFDRVAGSSYVLSDAVSGLLEGEFRKVQDTPGPVYDSFGNSMIRRSSMRRDDPANMNVCSRDDAGLPGSEAAARASSTVRVTPSGACHSNMKASAPGAPKKGRFNPRRLIPALIIIGIAVIIIFLFSMDMSQAVGMGFLCAALIWMVTSASKKRHSDVKNVWADENDPGDDEFYKSLLREVYAEDYMKNQYPPPLSREQQPVPSQYMSAPAPGRSQAVPGIKYPSAALLSLRGDVYPDIIISSSHMLLGKNPKSADAVLPDQTVSRTHARIEQRTDGYYVTDLYSTNGTSLDGDRLRPGQAYLIRDGALLELGALKYRASIPGSIAAKAG